MVEQVDRLVGNLLAGGTDVWLPEIGSLYIERRGAVRISKRLVTPPCRVVEFSSQQRGHSLVEEIARVIGETGALIGTAENPLPDPEQTLRQAQDIYDRWLARAREGDALSIGGVGTLKFKNFTIEESFDKRINPQGHAPVEIRAKRRMDWTLGVGIAAIVAVGVILGFWFLGEPKPSKQPTPDIAVHQPAVPVAVPAADSVAVSHAESAPTDVAAVVTDPVPATTVATEAPARLTSGHCYVVLGVFSTLENAERAAAAALKKEGTMRCSIYCFGAKFMLSPFESEDAEACLLFVRAHAAAFPEMWRYTAR